MTIPSEHGFRANKLFRGVPADVLHLAIEIPEVVEFDSGELIFGEGDPPDCMYLIADGCVRISKRGRGGQQETLSYLEAGEFFGEMALYDPEPRSAQAMAAEHTRLGRIGEAGFTQLLALAPSEISTNLTREIIKRLRKANTHFIHQMMEAERLSLVGSMASAIIHDFKNPMSVIQNAAELLTERTDDPQIVRFARMIRRSGDRMLGMTQEILDYSRGTTSLHLESVTIAQLLEELEDQALHRLPLAGIRVEKQIGFSGNLQIDRGRFVRLLLNIIKNAAEAMPHGGVCRFSVESRGDKVVFSVADTGCGIPKELLPRIFEPFVTHGKANGTGLGMAIAKAVVEAHKGRIAVESTPGAGTTIEIAIPNVAAE
jgi:signal transduction histidine kinase